MPSKAFARWLVYSAAVGSSVVLMACGGGGDASPTPTPVTVANCTPFSDSFGRTVSCAEMNTLAGANLPFLESSNGGGSGGGDGGGDGGADGSAGDGAPIVNATLQFTDVNGKTVTTTTDAKGYYRISLRGMKDPLVATVMRNDKPWKSMLINTIVRAPANRKFYTINLTGLTDVVVSELAKKDGLSSAEAVTPAAVARQKTQVPAIVSALNTAISDKIIAAGLDPAKFDPLTTAFVPDKTGYDMVLETVTINKVPGQFTTVAPKTVTSLTGSWQLSSTVTVDGFTQTVPVVTVPGPAVPSSLAQAQGNPANISGYSNQVIDGITYTSNGNVVTAVGPNTNWTLTINSFDVSNFVDCGSCGVGTQVTFAYSISTTQSGLVEGVNISPTTTVISGTMKYVRVN